MPVKAYIVRDSTGWRESCKLVFTHNAREAIKAAYQSEELEDVAYIDLRATRAYYADGHENDSEANLMLLNIKKGGWWYEIGGVKYTEENIDELMENEV